MGCDEQLGQEHLQAAQPHPEEDSCLHILLKDHPLQRWPGEGSIGRFTSTLPSNIGSQISLQILMNSAQVLCVR